MPNASANEPRVRPGPLRSFDGLFTAQFAQRTHIVVGELDASQPVYRAPVITVETADEPRAGSSISIKVPLQRLHFPCIMPTALYPSPQAHANPRLTSVSELHASGFET